MHRFEWDPKNQLTTQREDLYPGSKFEKSPRSQFNSTGGLKPLLQLERKAEFHASTQLRPDFPFETADTPRDPHQNRRGTLRFPPEQEMRPSSILPTPEVSREAPPNTKGFLTSHRHHEKFPEVTVATRGTPQFPATTQERPRDSPFNMN